ncbi:hypothetical protein CEXT_93331 [Caerostris extrusa]|uniref:Uncharacterized protein n=1 Tax=Caerostris extrusa TaxID=172846 RepID=A0AAV4XQ44_CAEEX|nr:hypothetical protein CEXT_93331 [Caerostris extrusa]
MSFFFNIERRNRSLIASYLSRDFHRATETRVLSVIISARDYLFSDIPVGFCVLENLFSIQRTCSTEETHQRSTMTFFDNTQESPVC